MVASSRIRFIAACSALLLAGTLAGCQGEQGDPAATSAPEELGFGDWVELADPGIHQEGHFYSGFSAGGRFWLFDLDDHTTLHSTGDGETWTTVRLTDAGVPAEAELWAGGNSCAALPVVREVEGAVELVYSRPYGTSHDLNLGHEFYFVTLGSGQPQLVASTANGLEVMPGDQGGFSFATKCLAGVFELGGGTVAIGVGQWWKPFDTGGFHAYTAVLGAGGQWTVHAIHDPATARSAESAPLDAVVVHEGTLLKFSGTGSGAVVWSSTDGLSWQRQTLPGFDGDARYVWAAQSEQVVVAVAQVYEGPGDFGEEYSYRAWHSTDGVSWSGPDVVAEHAAERPVLLAALSHGHYLAVQLLPERDGGINTPVLLHSTGSGWAPVELGNRQLQPLAQTLFVHGDGLISLRYDGVLLTTGVTWAG